MNIKKIVCDSLVMIYITSLLIYILVSNIRIKFEVYTILELSQVLIYFAGVGILLYIVNKVVNKIKFDIYDILMYLLVFFGIIATSYAIYPKISLYGFEGRYEGLLQLILYYVLFLNCKNLRNRLFKNIIVGIIIAVGIIQGLYGILQFFDIKEFLGIKILRTRYYSTGFEINPNFLGSLMILCFSLSLLVYLFKKNWIVTIVTLITSIILFLGVLCSGAMSSAVALILLFLGIVVFLLLLKKDWCLTLLKVLLLIVGFGISYKFFYGYDNGFYLKQIENTSLEMGETLKGNAEPLYGSGRIHIWKSTLDILPKNVLNGVGIDNFYYAFDNEEPLMDEYSGFYVDKVHNEYLQKLITEGIFSCFVYLIILLLLFIMSLVKIFKQKRKPDFLFLALFMSFCAYCVQAFFNISVISVAPIFYIVMGLLCSLIGDDKDEKIKYNRNSKCTVGDFEESC